MKHVRLDISAEQVELDELAVFTVFSDNSARFTHDNWMSLEIRRCRRKQGGCSWLRNTGHAEKAENGHRMTCFKILES